MSRSPCDDKGMKRPKSENVLAVSIKNFGDYPNAQSLAKATSGSITDVRV